METLEWRLWPDSDAKSGLDGLSHKRVTEAGFSHAVTSCAAAGGIALDLKSTVNMWSYDRLPLVPAPDIRNRLAFEFPELAGKVP